MADDIWPDYDRVLTFPVLLAVAGVYLGSRACEIVWRWIRKI